MSIQALTRSIRVASLIVYTFKAAWNVFTVPCASTPGTYYYPCSLVVNMLRIVLQLLRASHGVLEHILAGTSSLVSVIETRCDFISLESS